MNMGGSTYDTFDTVHVVLNLSTLTYHPPKGLLDADDVGQSHASLRWRNTESRADGQHCDHECQEYAEEIQTYT